MADPTQPWDKWQRLMLESAGGWADTLAAWTAALGDAAAPGAPADPAAALGAGLAALQQSLGALSHLGEELLAGLLRDQPLASSRSLDAATFSQLSRLLRLRWDEELQRLAEGPLPRVAAQAGEALGKLGPRLESMVGEYLRDLDSLKDDALRLDLGPLLEAFSGVLGGSAGERERKMVGRFLEAAAVKARYGAEYFADPLRTPVGQSPREEVGRVGRFTLYRYLPPAGAGPRHPTPVLLVYSVINKPYILDLVPGNSFVEHLLAQGLDVYLVDWGETQPGDRTPTLDDYIDPGLRECLEILERRTGARRVSLFGHCIGGNLALMLAALFPERVERLVVLTTPITTARGGVVALWTDPAVFPVDAIIDSYGHMPAKLIRYTFMAIKPYYEVMKWKMFFDNLGNDAVMAGFFPVDRWANDNVDIPGEMFRKFIHEVFHADRFSRHQTRVGDRRVDLRSIRCPVYTLAASGDWIVPEESARVINDLVGSADRRYTSIPGSHVGIMIDPRVRPLWTQMSDFLKEGSAAPNRRAKKVVPEKPKWRKPAIR